MPKGIPKAGKRNRQNKSGQVLDAAMRVFCFYGVLGATIGKIANEAGTSQGLVLRYYDTKEDIAVACIQRFLEEFSKKLFRLAERKNKTYREHVEDVFELFKVNRVQMKLVINVLCTPALERVAREISREYLGVAGQVVGKFADELTGIGTAELAYTMNAMYFTYVIGGNEENYRKARDELFVKYGIS